MPRREESPIKIAIDDAAQQVDMLNQAYQKYFLGIDKKPPLTMRSQMERDINALKREAPKIANAGLLFQINSVIAKYNVFANRWDKIMRQIEDGTYRGFRKGESP